MAIRGVLFDIDDTLVDYASAMRAAIEAHLAALGQPVGPDTYQRFRRIVHDTTARYLAGELTLHEHRREYARLVMGARLSDAEADAWLEGYLERLEAGWVLFPDVPPVLDALAGLRLGAVTNLDTAYQRRKLELVGLLTRFRCCVGIDLAGCAKPAPKIFHTGCAALGLAPDEVLYVGDRLHDDAVGARDAGLYGVWLDRSGTDGAIGGAPDGVAVIRSLTELPALVEKLGKAV